MPVEIDSREERVRRIATANVRLRELYRVPEGCTEDVVSYILNYYSKGKYDSLGLQAKFNTAMALLSRDLLISNAYKFNGEPDEFLTTLRKICPAIDLNDYEYIGMKSTFAVKELAKYCMGPNESTYPNDVFYKYHEKFKEPDEFPPIIVSPGMIQIDYARDGGVYVAPADQYTPPFGGGEINITVYKYKWHRIGKLPKQA